MTDNAEQPGFGLLANYLPKVDGKIFDEEIDYCLKITKKLQYPPEAVMDLYSLVHANVRLTHEITTLKKKYSTS